MQFAKIPFIQNLYKEIKILAETINNSTEKLSNASQTLAFWAEHIFWVDNLGNFWQCSGDLSLSFSYHDATTGEGLFTVFIEKGTKPFLFVFNEKTRFRERFYLSQIIAPTLEYMIPVFQQAYQIWVKENNSFSRPLDQDQQ